MERQSYLPGYLVRKHELTLRMNRGMEMLRSCRLCPRQCGARRLGDETGACGIGSSCRVASAFPHGGEEPCLTGWRGSGAIFFSGCSLHCVYCQNASISQGLEGRDFSGEELGSLMVALQMQGCHNINLVTPTHVMPQILEGLLWGVEKGLSLPLVYNTGGYDSLEALELLEGLVDIYLVDMKYASSETGRALSGVSRYGEVNRDALKEMYRQVGNLRKDSQGLAVRGLMVRHLVLPGHLEETREIAAFLAAEISLEVFVNLMPQYHPEGKAREMPPLDKPLGREEFAEALEIFRRAGLHPLL